MLRSPVGWAAAIWIGLLIHVDWHLGRPGPHRLSFDLPYHWLLAVAAFAPLPWVLVRRWPSAFVQASVLVIALGVALGQGLEPLGEVLHSHGEEQPFADGVRWRVFAEFMAAGLIAYVVAALAVRRRNQAAA